MQQLFSEGRGTTDPASNKKADLIEVKKAMFLEKIVLFCKILRIFRISDDKEFFLHYA